MRTPGALGIKRALVSETAVGELIGFQVSPPSVVYSHVPICFGLAAVVNSSTATTAMLIGSDGSLSVMFCTSSAIDTPLGFSALYCTAGNIGT